MNLFPFQEMAVAEIRDKYLRYEKFPNMTSGRRDPFIQFIRAVTGAGKTPIIAKSVYEMSLCDPNPVVLWTSKTSAVIGQTLLNLDSGGKYSVFVPGFIMKDISAVTIADIFNSQQGLIITSTVASFNRANKEGRRVFEPQIDSAGNVSIWEALEQRNSRPLIVVYDEGHNTTDNQIDLLLGLDPQVILLASATPKITPRLQSYIRGDLHDINVIQTIATTVETRYVVESELIKSTIKVTDYDNPDEYILGDMMAQFLAASEVAANSEPYVQPKCIYVSPTNNPNDQGLSFKERKARPIAIWRILVEKLGVNPADIAVYCSLKGNDFPKEFHLLRKFEDLAESTYRHIIFNLGLQEGWDDPEVYFAYIDKTLNSPVEITQIIGRVLRQPFAKRASHEALNSAHFFINCPTESFSNIMRGIRSEIGSFYNDPRNDYIRIIEQSRILPAVLEVKEGYNFDLPRLALKTDPQVVDEMKRELLHIPDYRLPSDQTLTEGKRQTKVVTVQDGSVTDLSEIIGGIGQLVQVGELLRTELMRLARDAAEALDRELTNQGRFNAKICYTSIAAEEIRSRAVKMAETYFNFVVIEPGLQSYMPSPFQPSTNNWTEFNHALHAGYDGLNDDEMNVAIAIDKLGLPWFRNLNNTDGFRIPLPLLSASVRNFYPDFVIIGKESIWCIDPKGGHLLSDAITYKLIDNITLEGNRKLRVILLSRGEYSIENDKLVPVGKKGVSLIGRRGSKSNLFTQHYADYDACIKSNFAGN